MEDAGAPWLQGSGRNSMTANKGIVAFGQVDRLIYLIRGQRVMMNMHLAAFYGVETRALNQAVKRNRARFPEDFAFRLTRTEAEWLVSQNVIPHKKHLGGSVPYAFTEEGVAMLSSVLRSTRAINVNIAVMRAFVRLREALSMHKELAIKLRELETKIAGHDESIRIVFDAIRQLMTPPVPPRRQIGFSAREARARYTARRKKSRE